LVIFIWVDAQDPLVFCLVLYIIIFDAFSNLDVYTFK